MGEATIRDVARRAELSVASVSRALNGHKSVRSETRARVIAAAEALGYVPHAGARSLSMARTHAIGVVLPDLHGEFFSEILRGMDGEAKGLGLQLLLSNMHADIHQAVQALKAMRGRVDGLVLMAPQANSAALVEALPATLPAVLVNSRAASAGRPLLRIDNRAGAAAVVEHLLAQGRRHIVHIGGPDSNVDAQERSAGFLEAMRSHAPDVTARVISGDFSEEAGEAAARAILAGSEPVDAVFAANDMMAIGCLQALRAAGVAVPERIAVAGFDDVPVARYLSLTTVRVRIAEIGARAIQCLDALLEGRDVDEVELHAPELVVRGTTVPTPTKQRF
ncbi:LacI family transcriptional regulator [Sphingomonas cannabina]|uniref:LacI family DNA-binding transcriptional regulator n=1 Tax=Sphingomonas cannabina TaxID=2899123 RepID=UPI001F23CA8C|nr:LacI family DNA-binding transcriptional regulator [Sphingomonas cannabina]UIJ44241.1 LacI family transcriptional regulator [Sphingomonas cannabina]